MPEQRPDILVIVTDQQRQDTILGATPCRTPTWNRVANEGAVFEQARTSCPLCQPARAALFTGCYPHRAGIAYEPSSSWAEGSAETPIRVVVPSVHQRLRDAGYQVFHTGKWELGPDRFEEHFDRFAGCAHKSKDYIAWCKAQGLPIGKVFIDPERSMEFRSHRPPHMSSPKPGILHTPADKTIDAWVMQHAREMLAERDPNRPLFMSVCLHGPHPPYVIPAEYYDRYNTALPVKPSNWGPTRGEPSFLASSYMRQIFHDWGNDFERWRKTIAVYWGFVSYLDDLIARFVAQVEASGRSNNTLVVMAADHGDMIGQHGLVQKMCPYQECVRVPLVMRWPGRIAPGTQMGMDVSNVDITPTLLAAAGVNAATRDFDGKNLLPYITGERPQPPARDTFSAFTLSAKMRTWHGVEDWQSIHRRPWSFTRHANGETELYNLANDPWETSNVAAAPQNIGVVKELHASLGQWMRQQGIPETINATGTPAR